MRNAGRRGGALRLAAAAVCLCAAAASPGAAADAEGNFAIKGAGLQTCGALLKAWDEGTRDLSLYAGWLSGYVTGHNMHVADTYDATPWQTAETLLGIVRGLCLEAPAETRFMDVAHGLLVRLAPQRLTERSEIEGVQRDGRAVVIYREVLTAAKARLREAGHDPGGAAEFDGATATALAAFQRERGLEPSGLPDQRTLFELFLRPAAD